MPSVSVLFFYGSPTDLLMGDVMESVCLNIYVFCSCQQPISRSIAAKGEILAREAWLIFLGEWCHAFDSDEVG